MDITLLRKAETLAILSDPEFISTWQLLAKKSQEFTLIQQYALVSTWYQSYLKKYDPLMVIGYDSDTSIVGILPLAISRENGTISHAGDYQAEYNGWICKKEHEEDFLIQSVILIKKELQLNTWDWGWMPPNANTHWLHSEQLKKHGIYVNVSTCESPVYQLNDTTRINKIKKSKSTKSKINRLKRSGDLRIERITDLSAAKEIFIDLKKIYDFRSLAAYNIMPFRDDDSKEKWHLDYLESSEDVHFTVLWQGDDLLACNFGYCSEDTVIIGLFTYNPVQGAHSPGNVFLIMLIDFITQNGYQYLDLSPGGDPYKERFCNTHNTLTKPVFCFNSLSKYKNSAKTYLIKKIKERYSYRDITTIKERYKNNIKNIVSLGKHSSTSSSKDQALYLFNPTSDDIKEKVNKEVEMKESVDMDIGIQKYDDLLLYQPVDGHETHKEVIFSALKYFERGDTLYTLVKNGKLIFYTWVSTSGKKHPSTKINAYTSFTGNHTLLYNTFLLGDGFENKSLIADFILNVMNKSNLAISTNIYLIKPPSINEEQIQQMNFSRVNLV